MKYLIKNNLLLPMRYALCIKLRSPHSVKKSYMPYGYAYNMRASLFQQLHVYSKRSLHAKAF